MLKLSVLASLYFETLLTKETYISDEPHPSRSRFCSKGHIALLSQQLLKPLLFPSRRDEQATLSPRSRRVTRKGSDRKDTTDRRREPDSSALADATGRCDVCLHTSMEHEAASAEDKKMRKL